MLITKNKRRTKKGLELPKKLSHLKDMKIGIELETILDTRSSIIVPNNGISGGTIPVTIANLYTHSVEPNAHLFDMTPVLANSDVRSPNGTKFVSRSAAETMVSSYLQTKYKNLLYGDVGRDGGGIEIRFKPFTYSEFMSFLPEIEGLLNFLIECGFQPESAPSAGIHIHLDRKYFDHTKYLSIANWVNRNKGFMANFSGRRQCNGGYSCYVPVLFMPSPGMPFETGVNSDAGIKLNGFSKIDGTTIHTLEFRLFNSMLKFPRFVSFVQFLFALHYLLGDQNNANLTSERLFRVIESEIPEFSFLTSEWGKLLNLTYVAPVVKESPKLESVSTQAPADAQNNPIPTPNTQSLTESELFNLANNITI